MMVGGTDSQQDEATRSMSGAVGPTGRSETDACHVMGAMGRHQQGTFQHRPESGVGIWRGCLPDVLEVLDALEQPSVGLLWMLRTGRW